MIPNILFVLNSQLISVGLSHFEELGIYPVERLDVVGMGGVEWCVDVLDMAGYWEFEDLDAFDNHLGYLVGSIGVEMGVVGEGLRLTRIGVGWIVYQCVLGTFET